MKDLLELLWAFVKVILSWCAMGIIGLIIIWLPIGCVFLVQWLWNDGGTAGKIFAIPTAIAEAVGVYYLFKLIFKGWRPWEDRRHEGFGPW